MVDAGEPPGLLAFEAPQGILREEFASEVGGAASAAEGEELEGDRVAHVLGAPHLAVRALADLLDERVAVDDLTVGDVPHDHPLSALNYTTHWTRGQPAP